MSTTVGGAPFWLDGNNGVLQLPSNPTSVQVSENLAVVHLPNSLLCVMHIPNLIPEVEIAA